MTAGVPHFVYQIEDDPLHQEIAKYRHRNRYGDETSEIRWTVSGDSCRNGGDEKQCQEAKPYPRKDSGRWAGYSEAGCASPWSANHGWEGWHGGDVVSGGKSDPSASSACTALTLRQSDNLEPPRLKCGSA